MHVQQTERNLGRLRQPWASLYRFSLSANLPRRNAAATADDLAVTAGAACLIDEHELLASSAGTMAFRMTPANQSAYAFARKAQLVTHTQLQCNSNHSLAGAPDHGTGPCNGDEGPANPVSHPRARTSSMAPSRRCLRAAFGRSELDYRARARRGPCPLQYRCRQHAARLGCVAQKRKPANRPAHRCIPH